MVAAADVIGIADSFVGNIHEDPPGSNCTPIGVEFGFNCVEWCCEFVSVVYARAGVPLFHTASVADSIAQAQAGTNGMLWLPANATIQAADIANFDFGGHGNPADFHDSIVRDPMTQANFQTDGGNESSQVLQRVVDRTFVTGFIRPALTGGGGGGGTGPVQGVVSCGLTAVQLSGFEAEFFVFQSIGQGTGGGGGGTGPGGSGTISYAEAEGYWIAGGGPPEVASIAAAITVPESSTQPGEIQQGEPYGTTGWGLWQITPGNSFDGDPAVGQDYQLLDPLRNARAAVRKYQGAGNSFRPWTTYVSGAYRSHVQDGVPPAQVGDPGQFIPIGSAPSGTHNTSMPGSTA